MVRPTGTVTFLFTDIEGSTRRWESDPEAMRSALATHDEVLRTAVEGRGGWLFKHTGDGVCAAFPVAADAVGAAVEAQRGLELPVRMGIGTGSAELRGEDYFGPALNRTARVMDVGHGGQILVAASTAALLDRVDGVDLVDLGEHRLRDLSGAHHLYQVRAVGLDDAFPTLRTVDAIPGNLPVLATSFVGRDAELKEVSDLVRRSRLVTLTGVGGVGKTRLALQVAAGSTDLFPDGVWLVELAPLGEPAAVPDLVATALGVTPRPDMSITASIAQALSGRRMLVILDNCEHVLDATASLVETILGRTSTVRVLATSREGLRVEAEQLWPVPSLDVAAGLGSPAVELFVERARAVDPGFGLDDEADAAAVHEICERLDGIALGIELAAARMVSMTPAEVRDRLGDRFRLLAGGRRGLERHQTLRHAVAWSHDLLADDERLVLQRCAVFAGGFDLDAAVALCSADRWDEYGVLDVLDSLVRKSLLTAGRSAGRTRYGMLETIRQFAEEQLAASGTVERIRDDHSRYFAAQVVAYWQRWDGPDQRVALDWVDTELANLRAAFRWASDRQDLATAAAIAADTTLLGMLLMRYEPASWAEELLPAAATAGLAQLPRLYAAASLCFNAGRPDDGAAYARAATALERDPGSDPVPLALSRYFEGAAHLNAGRLDDALQIWAALSAETGLSPLYSGAHALILGFVGRMDEAVAIADEALELARLHGNPYFIAQALWANGLAFARVDPNRAVTTLHEGLAYVRANRVPLVEANLARDTARLEAAHGDADRALALYGDAIDLFHQAGDIVNLGGVLGQLAVSFDRLGRAEIAATLYGAASELNTTPLGRLPDRLRAALGDREFARAVTAGAAMPGAEAVRHARDQIQLVRHELAGR